MPPSSSPISSNPLLRRIRGHTFFPARKHSDIFCMCDASKAWLAAEGLVPVADDFRTPGFVSSQLVGGITYKVYSPKSQCLGTGKLSTGRELFDGHRSAVREPPGTLSVAPQPGPHSPCNDPFEQDHLGLHIPHAPAPFHTQVALQMASQAHTQTHNVCIAYFPPHLLH